MRSGILCGLFLLGLTPGHLHGGTSQPDTTRSYLWGLVKVQPRYKIDFEEGYWTDRFFHRREFHAPVTFIPLEIRWGVGYNGGGGEYLAESVASSWMRYEQSVSKFDGGSFMGRTGQQLELDVGRINLARLLFKTSWLDTHTGLMYRSASLFLPASLPISSWGAVQSSWDVGSRKFAPKISEFSISNSVILQWAEWWFLSVRYTYGLAMAKFYMNGSGAYDASPTARGPSFSYGIGIRVILDPGGANRFTLGLDAKHSYTKFSQVTDPDDLTPIRRFDLSNFGLYVTFSAFYGGRKTSGDLGKEYYYRRDYVSAQEQLQTFLTEYPNHANRHRAETLIAECERKIPYQLMKEGMWFDEREETGKAVGRYLEARKLTEADTALSSGLDERLDQIAQSQLEKANQMILNGNPEQALEVVRQVAVYSPRGEAALPEFQARAFIFQGRKALYNGFPLKASNLFDLALKFNPEVRIEVQIYRAQIATQLVEQANEIKDPEAIRLVIHSLDEARNLVGGLGTANERILEELKEKLARVEEAQIKTRIEDRMEWVRAARDRAEEPELELGMTIPQVQDILGKPGEVIHKVNDRGEDTQLWIYTLTKSRSLQLSFLDYILFRIEEE